MKVVAVLGSPRKYSISSQLAQAAVAALPQAALEVKSFVLNKLDYQGCQACLACKGKSEICVLKDDLTPVLAAVSEADLLILTSPVYIGEVSGQVKCFIDRTYSYFLPDYITNPQPSRLAPGKKMFFILTQGMPDRPSMKGRWLDIMKVFSAGSALRPAASSLPAAASMMRPSMILSC